MTAIETMPFGKTGHTSTRMIFGAAAVGAMQQDRADAVLETLLEFGINHLDVAAMYGAAELRLAPWLQDRRDEFFLATKTLERMRAEAAESIDNSLARMEVDTIDLIQLHNLTDDEGWDQAMGPGGALEALVEAREQGKVRFLGVTGHGTRAPSMHLRSLEHYPFDSVLVPFNYIMMQNEQYANDFVELLAVCKERGVAVQTIKSIARGPWATGSATYNTWYEPLSDQSDIDKAMHWCLSRPRIFLNTVGDLTLLPKVLDAATRHEGRPSDEAMLQFQQEAGLTSLFGLGS